MKVRSFASHSFYVSTFKTYWLNLLHKIVLICGLILLLPTAQIPKSLQLKAFSPQGVELTFCVAILRTPSGLLFFITGSRTGVQCSFFYSLQIYMYKKESTALDHRTQTCQYIVETSFFLLLEMQWSEVRVASLNKCYMSNRHFYYVKTSIWL